MTVPEFLSLGYTSWVEIHWSRAGTDKQAEAIFKEAGYEGKFYKMPFGYWLGIENETSN